MRASRSSVSCASTLIRRTSWNRKAVATIARRTRSSPLAGPAAAALERPLPRLADEAVHRRAAHRAVHRGADAAREVVVRVGLRQPAEDEGGRAEVLLDAWPGGARGSSRRVARRGRRTGRPRWVRTASSSAASRSSRSPTSRSFAPARAALMSTRARAIELSSPSASKAAISSSRRRAATLSSGADVVGAGERLLPPPADAAEPVGLRPAAPRCRGCARSSSRRRASASPGRRVHRPSSRARPPYHRPPLLATRGLVGGHDRVIVRTLPYDLARERNRQHLRGCPPGCGGGCRGGEPGDASPTRH